MVAERRTKGRAWITGSQVWHDLHPHFLVVIVQPRSLQVVLPPPLGCSAPVWHRDHLAHLRLHGRHHSLCIVQVRHSCFRMYLRQAEYVPGTAGLCCSASQAEGRRLQRPPLKLGIYVAWPDGWWLGWVCRRLQWNCAWLSQGAAALLL